MAPQKRPIVRLLKSYRIESSSNQITANLTSNPEHLTMVSTCLPQEQTTQIAIAETTERSDTVPIEFAATFEFKLIRERRAFVSPLRVWLPFSCLSHSSPHSRTLSCALSCPLSVPSR